MQKQFEIIQKILLEAGEEKLSENLEFITPNQILSIHKMIDEMKKEMHAATYIAMQVVHDVTGFLEGKADFKPHCQIYVNMMLIEPC